MKTPYTNNKNTNINKPRVSRPAGAEYEQCEYSYYSRLLNKPFDSLVELKQAEAAYREEQRAKEDKAATKKADATRVEEAFKTLNKARKAYKENLIELTDRYTKDLTALKETYEADKADINKLLASAEESYANILKAFTEKYPEGYHLTLKDGDFETTISSAHTAGSSKIAAANIFDWLLGF